MANGLAADVVTAACLATSAPVVVAPAMDGEMYAHPATRANVARLRDGFGYAIVEPEVGPLASGQTGVGRLAELGRIVDAVVAAIGEPAGSPAGPGPRAARVAEPAARRRPRRSAHRGHRRRDARGDRSGPLHRQSLERPDGRGDRRRGPRARRAGQPDRAAASTCPCRRGAEITRIESTAELEAALGRCCGAGPNGRAGFDVLIMAAAVADFRPRHAGTDQALARLRR